MTKYIFVTGGVVSSVGKGVTVASIGRLLKSRGFTVAAQKLDPYINVDPGTLAPHEHGEVFVLDDGAETDLDLGTYERFIDQNLTRACSVTTGQVYAEVIARERRGDYLGKTIQVIPHITSEIKRRIGLVSKQLDSEIVIVEVGGTVGDIEGLPFLEAIRQMRKDVGRENTVYVHVTLLPYIGATKELKTKPTQHSVKELRSIGIQPDIIVCRSDYPIDEDLKSKISLFCDVEKDHVIPLVTAQSVYEVPLILERAGLGDVLVRALSLPDRGKDLSEWENIVEKLRNQKEQLRIGLVGKYGRLADAYLSVREAIRHAGMAEGCKINLIWIDSEDLERGRGRDLLETVDGLVVPGGFGYRGIEGKIIAARYARENKVPYLGLCLGLQVMVIELARYVLGSDEPNSTEFDRTTTYPVIDVMADQKDITDMGGTMRLGNYPCHLVAGTNAARAYQAEVVFERHRHRFELNNAYRDILAQGGMILSGFSPDRKLAEIGEIANHPWMVGTQFHPEFKSRPNRAHPLFVGLIRAAKQYRDARRHEPDEHEEMIAGESLTPEDVRVTAETVTDSF